MKITYLKLSLVIWLLLNGALLPPSSPTCLRISIPQVENSRSEMHTTIDDLVKDRPDGENPPRSSINYQSSEGLILHLPFDEGVGNIAYDYSGNGNDGRIYGGSWRQGISGDALELDGQDGYVNCGTDSSTDIIDTITLEAWVYVYGYTSYYTLSQVIVGKWQYNGLDAWSYLLELSPGGRYLRLYFSNIEIQGPTAIPRNEWVHVAGTYDGHTLSMYVNGELTTSSTHGNAMSRSQAPLVVGGHNGTAERNSLNGRIDEVRVYNRSLRATEIWYDSQASLFNSSEGWIGWWIFSNVNIIAGLFLLAAILPVLGILIRKQKRA